MTDETTEAPEPASEPAARPRSAAAERALAEAAQRKAAYDAKAAALVKTREYAGRGGLDPVRYDDWEIKGLTSDF